MKIINVLNEEYIVEKVGLFSESHIYSSDISKLKLEVLQNLSKLDRGEVIKVSDIFNTYYIRKKSLVIRTNMELPANAEDSLAYLLGMGIIVVAGIIGVLLKKK